MSTIYNKIKNGDYECKVPYPNRPVKPKLKPNHDSIDLANYNGQFERWERELVAYKIIKEEYDSKFAQCRERFKKDVMVESGASDYTCSEVIWERARSNASSDFELVGELVDIVEFIEKCGFK